MQAPPETLLAEGARHYVDQFDRLGAHLPGMDVDWLAERRRHSLAHFGRVGFPSVRDEDWRYTPLRPITGKSFDLVAGDAASDDMAADAAGGDQAIPGLDCHRLVFVDGVLDPRRSSTGELAPGLGVMPMSAAAGDDALRQQLGSVLSADLNGFTALNGALFTDGVVITLAPGARPDTPLELLFISSRENGFAQPRNLVVAGEDSAMQIIERYVSATGGPTLTNGATEVILRERAELDYYVVQTQSERACQVCAIWADQAASSRFSCRTVTLGGGLVRNDLKTQMNGANAHCDMLGVYSLAGRQHVDNHTTMVHAAEDCVSRERYKGVLDQRSRGVFHGRIKVEPGARGTDAAQGSNTLILSGDAEIDAKPQLEIYADEVRCSHGATIGQIDENSLFYLRSRGIDREQARSLLTYAFVNDVLMDVAIEPLRVFLEHEFNQRLAREADSAPGARA